MYHQYNIFISDLKCHIFDTFIVFKIYFTTNSQLVSYRETDDDGKK